MADRAHSNGERDWNKLTNGARLEQGEGLERVS